ncbi:RNaseH domain-containing protein [Nonomuraea dietziae]|uniref:RNaseH domain-containing protein n=1 Tax=Nonomuraea dietziae TaxID=65515 RepID=UPI0033F328A2
MVAAKNRRRLDVLAYRCTPDLLGGSTVYLRDFSAGVNSMWKILERNYRDRMGRDEIQAPHSIATNALRCLTGGYVYFDPERGFLVSRDPIDDDTLCDAFTLMSGLATGLDIDDIDLSNPGPLGERIAATSESQRVLADYLSWPPGRQPDAEAWVYRSATWDLSRKLAKHAWAVDGREIRLRPDSEGGLVAWDDPWSNKKGTAHAVGRVRMVMKTMPNISDPLILLSASVTRIQNSMSYARTVLVEQADSTLPLVEVEMAGRTSIRTINKMALQTLGRLGMDHSVLHGIQERVRLERDQERKALEAGAERWIPPHEPLGSIRPIYSRNYKFPVGRGVGMHFLRELDQHVRKIFTDSAVSPRIFFDTQGFKQLKRKELFASPKDVARSLRAMGYDHLRLVCLWHRDENRLRMMRGLSEAYGLGAQTLDPVDGEAVSLFQDTVSAVFHKAERFLTHGPRSGMEVDLQNFKSLKPPQGMLIGVWAETEYDSSEDQEESEGQEATNSGTGQTTGAPVDGEDAKHRARRTLASLDVVSQFMKDLIPNKSGKDHQAVSAQLDLNRSLGIIDRRIDNVMTDAIGPYAADGVAHCGIHVRRQAKKKGDRAAKISITATVLKPPGHEGEAWTLHGWSYTDRRWQPYHLAQAAFHRADYPEGKLTEFLDDNQGYKKVAQTLDQALADLARYLDRIPYTVTVDGLATRRLWAGLHNNKQGELGGAGVTWLPGYTLPVRDRPIAIIRLNKSVEEVVRPIGVTRLNVEEEMIGDTDTTTSLYRLEPDFGDPTWLLVTVPTQYDGAGAGRLGGNKTRWTASHGSNVEGELKKNEMRANWYAMNATEIYVIPLRDDVPAAPLARMTARLCHQSLAWTNRTRYSAHLHAAQQMDLDHPHYRRSALTHDPEADTVGEAAIEYGTIGE